MKNVNNKSIYRYYRPNEWDYLFPQNGTGTIRFTPITETNDPHEGKVVVLGVARDKHDLMRLKDLPEMEKIGNLIDIICSLSEQDIEKKLDASRNIFAKMLQARRQYFGIFSATNSPNDIVMWEHYSENHTGFMVEFDANHSLFNTPHGLKNVFGTLHNVEYQDIMPEASLVDLFLNPNEMYCKKHTDWSYESEVRIVYELDHDIFLSGTMRGCTTIPEGLIKSVTFGYKSSWKKLACQIRSDGRYNNIQLFNAGIDNASYVLSYHPLSSDYGPI